MLYPDLFDYHRSLADLEAEIYGAPERQALGLKARVAKIESTLTYAKLIAAGVLINITLTAAGPIDWAALGRLVAALLTL